MSRHLFKLCLFVCVCIVLFAIFARAAAVAAGRPVEYAFFVNASLIIFSHVLTSRYRSEKREEVNKHILKEEEEKAKIQKDLSILTDRLSQINESLARKAQARNEYDKTIQETEAAYMKVRKGPSGFLFLFLFCFCFFCFVFFNSSATDCDPSHCPQPTFPFTTPLSATAFF